MFRRYSAFCSIALFGIVQSSPFNLEYFQPQEDIIRLCIGPFIVIDGDKDTYSSSFASTTFISSYDVYLELGPHASQGFPLLGYLVSITLPFIVGCISHFFKVLASSNVLDTPIVYLILVVLSSVVDLFVGLLLQINKIILSYLSLLACGALALGSLQGS